MFKVYMGPRRHVDRDLVRVRCFPTWDSWNRTFRCTRNARDRSTWVYRSGGWYEDVQRRVTTRGQLRGNWQVTRLYLLGFRCWRNNEQ